MYRNGLGRGRSPTSPAPRGPSSDTTSASPAGPWLQKCQLPWQWIMGELHKPSSSAARVS